MPGGGNGIVYSSGFMGIAVISTHLHIDKDG